MWDFPVSTVGKRRVLVNVDIFHINYSASARIAAQIVRSPDDEDEA